MEAFAKQNNAQTNSSWKTFLFLATDALCKHITATMISARAFLCICFNRFRKPCNVWEIDPWKYLVFKWWLIIWSWFVGIKFPTCPARTDFTLISNEKSNFIPRRFVLVFLTFLCKHALKYYFIPLGWAEKVTWENFIPTKQDFGSTKEGSQLAGMKSFTCNKPEHPILHVGINDAVGSSHQQIVNDLLALKQFLKEKLQNCNAMPTKRCDN